MRYTQVEFTTEQGTLIITKSTKTNETEFRCRKEITNNVPFTIELLGSYLNKLNELHLKNKNESS